MEAVGGGVTVSVPFGVPPTRPARLTAYEASGAGGVAGVKGMSAAAAVVLAEASSVGLFEVGGTHQRLEAASLAFGRGAVEGVAKAAALRAAASHGGSGVSAQRIRRVNIGGARGGVCGVVGVVGNGGGGGGDAPPGDAAALQAQFDVPLGAARVAPGESTAARGAFGAAANCDPSVKVRADLRVLKATASRGGLPRLEAEVHGLSADAAAEDANIAHPPLVLDASRRHIPLAAARLAAHVEALKESEAAAATDEAMAAAAATATLSRPAADVPAVDHASCVRLLRAKKGTTGATPSTARSPPLPSVAMEEIMIDEAVGAEAAAARKLRERGLLQYAAHLAACERANDADGVRKALNRLAVLHYEVGGGLVGAYAIQTWLAAAVQKRNASILVVSGGDTETLPPTVAVPVMASSHTATYVAGAVSLPHEWAVAAANALQPAHTRGDVQQREALLPGATVPLLTGGAPQPAVPNAPPAEVLRLPLGVALAVACARRHYFVSFQYSLRNAASPVASDKYLAATNAGLAARALGLAADSVHYHRMAFQLANAAADVRAEVVSLANLATTEVYVGDMRAAEVRGIVNALYLSLCINVGGLDCITSGMFGEPITDRIQTPPSSSRCSRL